MDKILCQYCKKGYVYICKKSYFGDGLELCSNSACMEGAVVPKDYDINHSYSSFKLLQDINKLVSSHRNRTPECVTLTPAVLQDSTDENIDSLLTSITPALPKCLQATNEQSFEAPAVAQVTHEGSSHAGVDSDFNTPIDFINEDIMENVWDNSMMNIPLHNELPNFLDKLTDSWLDELDNCVAVPTPVKGVVSFPVCSPSKGPILTPSDSSAFFKVSPNRKILPTQISNWHDKLTLSEDPISPLSCTASEDSGFNEEEIIKVSLPCDSQCSVVTTCKESLPLFMGHTQKCPPLVSVSTNPQLDAQLLSWGISKPDPEQEHKLLTEITSIQNLFNQPSETVVVPMDREITSLRNDLPCHAHLIDEIDAFKRNGDLCCNSEDFKNPDVEVIDEEFESLSAGNICNIGDKYLLDSFSSIPPADYSINGQMKGPISSEKENENVTNKPEVVYYDQINCNTMDANEPHSIVSKADSIEIASTVADPISNVNVRTKETPIGLQKPSCKALCQAVKDALVATIRPCRVQLTRLTESTIAKEHHSKRRRLINSVDPTEATSKVDDFICNNASVKTKESPIELKNPSCKSLEETHVSITRPCSVEVAYLNDSTIAKELHPIGSFVSKAKPTENIEVVPKASAIIDTPMRRRKNRCKAQFESLREAPVSSPCSVQIARQKECTLKHRSKRKYPDQPSVPRSILKKKKNVTFNDIIETIIPSNVSSSDIPVSLPENLSTGDTTLNLDFPNSHMNISHPNQEAIFKLPNPTPSLYLEGIFCDEELSRMNNLTSEENSFNELVGEKLFQSQYPSPSKIFRDIYNSNAVPVISIGLNDEISLIGTKNDNSTSKATFLNKNVPRSQKSMRTYCKSQYRRKYRSNPASSIKTPFIYSSIDSENSFLDSVSYNFTNLTSNCLRFGNLT